MKKRKRKVKIDWKAKTLKFGFMAGICAVVLGILMLGYIILTAPEFKPEKMKDMHASIVYDKNGKEIATLGTEKREFVSFEELPEVLVDAILATEDARFYNHGGFDLPRFVKSFLVNIQRRGFSQGGSTLSMQVVKQYLTSAKKSVVRKLQDIYLAMWKLERYYTKEQIIEFYVNHPYLGGYPEGVYGVEAVSKVFFGKSVRYLTLPEAAIIAGIFQAPGKYDPFINPELTNQRKNTVLNLMYKHGYITEVEYNTARAIHVSDLIVKQRTISNPYQGYIDAVIEEIERKTGLNPYKTAMEIYTNLDTEAQKLANHLLSDEGVVFPDEKIQTGFAILESKTGKVIAIGSGRNRDGQRLWNYATRTRRQPGSAAKPIFVYAPGFELLKWSTYKPFIDESWSYSDKKHKTIQNWDGKFMGFLSLDEALYLSRNIPAVKGFQEIIANKQMKNLVEFVQKLGIKPELSNGSMHEAHALGAYSNGTTPVELAGAYAAFANNGYYIEPYIVSKIVLIDTNEEINLTPKKIRAMSEETAFLVRSVLIDGVTKGLTTDHRIPGITLGVKSGTTNYDEETKKKFKLPSDAVNDLWTAGFTPDYTVAIWLGYDEINNKYYNKISNKKYISSLFKSIIRGLPKSTNSFKTPSGIIKVDIENNTNPARLASPYTPSDLVVSKYFIKGTEPTQTSGRFDQFKNATNLVVSDQGDNIKLTWDKTETPIVLTDDYIKSLYTKTYYGTFANKMYQKHIKYNKEKLGRYGYKIYLVDEEGNEKYLGFTEDNEFTYEKDGITELYKFIVRTSYEKYDENQSTGVVGEISVYVLPNFIIETKQGEEISIPVGGSINLEEIIVVYDLKGNDVTSLCELMTIIRLNGLEETETINTNEEGTYTITYKVIYAGIEKEKTITLQVVEETEEPMG